MNIGELIVFINFVSAIFVYMISKFQNTKKRKNKLQQ